MLISFDAHQAAARTTKGQGHRAGQHVVDALQVVYSTWSRSSEVEVAAHHGLMAVMCCC
jgi:hypothetical protein